MQAGGYSGVSGTSVVGPAPSPVVQEVRFRFTGEAREYFRIWIVNVLLTILTLGIYSAWAKVRNKQYFYRNTWLGDSSFEYLANPIAILKGRIVIGAAFGLAVASQLYDLRVYLAVLLGIACLLPWAFAKALAFNARNSAYRHVRFSFSGTPAGAYGSYLLGGLVYLMTCGWGFAYLQWKLTGFAATNHLWGLERFCWKRPLGAYFRVFFMTILLSLPILVPVVAVTVFAAMAGGGGEPDANVITLALFSAYPLLIIPYSYSRAQSANLLYDGLEIGAHRLTSRQQFLPLLKLQVVNLLGIVVSLGLLVPWAKVRMAQYRAQCMSAFVHGSLETEANMLAGKQAAYGEAMADMGDLDMDLG
jgi:uncharacterized membrane protein YjgN (DUF898 family)